MKTNLETEMVTGSKLYAPKKEGFCKLNKKDLKKSFLKELGLKKNTNRLTAGIVLSKTDSDINYLFEEIMPGLNDLDINVIVVGEQKNHYLNYSNIYYIARNTRNMRQTAQACDLILLPDETIEDNALRSGTPCVYINTPSYRGNLIDFKPLEELGNGFLMRKKSSWLLFQSICKALETYNFSYDWGTVCKNAYETGQSL
jgi:hypothetical protein